MTMRLWFTLAVAVSVLMPVFSAAQPKEEMPFSLFINTTVIEPAFFEKPIWIYDEGVMYVIPWDDVFAWVRATHDPRGRAVQ